MGKVKCTIQYFKDTGKYYSEGECELEAEHHFQIREQIQEMLNRGKRPGLLDGYEFTAYCTSTHPNDVPFLVFPRRHS